MHGAYCSKHSVIRVTVVMWDIGCLTDVTGCHLHAHTHTHTHTHLVRVCRRFCMWAPYVPLVSVIGVLLLGVKLLCVAGDHLCHVRGSTVVKVLCYNSEGRWFDPS